jgi:hypothetical protein
MSNTPQTLSVGMHVQVKPECDIPAAFRNGPSVGVIDQLSEDGTAIVIVEGKSVPYAIEEIEPA